MKKKTNITIDDIAVMAGVSKTTVSRYINGKFEYMSAETREKIKDIIKQYNYIPSNVARSLKTKTTKLIAFIVADIENAFAAPTIKAMNESLFDSSYHIVVSSSNDSILREKQLIESVLEQRVDGILLNAVNYDAPHLTEMNIDVPLILVDRRVRDFSVDFVGTNSVKSIHDAVSHLKMQGYNDVHLITEDFSSIEPRFRRVEGFKDMMINYGYTEEQLDKNFIHVIDGKNDALNVVGRIVGKNSSGVPAIICTNGRTSLKVAKAIKDLDLRMPFEIGLVSYDDFGNNNSYGWTQLNSPSITRLSPNWYQTGYKAMELLKSRLENPNGPKKDIKVDVILIEDGSTKLRGF